LTAALYAQPLVDLTTIAKVAGQRAGKVVVAKVDTEALPEVAAGRGPVRPPKHSDDDSFSDRQRNTAFAWSATGRSDHGGFARLRCLRSFYEGDVVAEWTLGRALHAPPSAFDQRTKDVQPSGARCGLRHLSKPLYGLVSPSHRPDHCEVLAGALSEILQVRRNGLVRSVLK
jgi:hypothetical protein